MTNHLWFEPAASKANGYALHGYRYGFVGYIRKSGTGGWEYTLGTARLSGGAEKLSEALGYPKEPTRAALVAKLERRAAVYYGN